MGRENIFKPTIGNESLHQDSNDNGVRIVNFVTSKNLVVKRTMFPHRGIHNHTLTSPDGKTNNQIDRILIDRRWHSNILDVQSFRGTDFDIDHYPMVVKFRESLAVSKQAAQKFDGERFNLRTLNDLEVRKHYQVEITKRFAALETLRDGEDINRALENIKKSIKTSSKQNLILHEGKQHKPCFDEF